MTPSSREPGAEHHAHGVRVKLRLSFVTALRVTVNLKTDMR